jgi:hypothetical protein
VDLRHLTWKQSAGSVASDGVYLKAEQTVDGIKHYYKLSNYDVHRGVFGHEAVNELIAYRLGKALGFNVPECDLQKALVCVDNKEFEAFVYIAESFKPEKASREAFDKFYEQNLRDSDESPLAFCKRLDWTDDIYKMFIFDYLIINRDRHGANLEVFKNGGKILSPLFDNGVSFVFLYAELDSDLETFDDLADLPVNNFIGTRSLRKNLGFIDKKLQFNDLPADLEQQLFADLEDVLPERYYKKILNIIEKRWKNVKEFRLV